ncbi:hypothetical protein VPH49_26130 [Pseudomonas luteola]|uniref:hypothetical protein n=1 Tax=Pseudomonas luteola TaxID=47886 RepID=UPI003A87D64D
MTFFDRFIRLLQPQQSADPNHSQSHHESLRFNRHDLYQAPSLIGDWPIKEERVCGPIEGQPEHVVMTLLSRGNWFGCHSEGHLVRSISRTLILPDLIYANPFRSIDNNTTPYIHAIHFLVKMTSHGAVGSPEHNVTPEQFIERMHNTIHKRLKEPISSLQADFDAVVSRGSFLTSTPVKEGVPINRFISAIHEGFWHDLLDIYAIGNGKLASGWPDLELSDGTSFNFVEVKVRDRLTPNQKDTIPILMDLGLKCRVIRLIRR